MAREPQGVDTCRRTKILAEVEGVEMPGALSFEPHESRHLHRECVKITLVEEAKGEPTKELVVRIDDLEYVAGWLRARLEHLSAV